MKFNPEEFIGKIYKTNSCGDCFVIDAKSSTDMTVMFYDGYVAKVYKGNLDKGKVRNPYFKSNRSLGIYDVKLRHREGILKVQTLWRNILQRCYMDDFHKRHPTYSDVNLSEEWFRYTDFENDILSMENSDRFLNDGWVLDKDGIIIGNRLYSKETCCFIPKSLNSKISSLAKLEQDDVGYSLLPSGWFRVVVGGEGHIGCYRTKCEATRAYKYAKAKNILKSIKSYEGQLSERFVQSIVGYIFTHVPELKFEEI